MMRIAEITSDSTTEFQGYYPPETVQELLGSQAVRTSRNVTFEHVGLRLLDFIMSGPKIPGLNIHVRVDASVGEVSITGESSSRGLRNKVTDVPLKVSGPQRAVMLAGMALRVANGDNTVSFQATYDGSLEIPEGVNHVSNHEAARASDFKGVTFCDPFLPHPDAKKYPNSYPTEQPGLIGNRLQVVSRADNIANAYTRSATALAAATGLEQTTDTLRGMIAIAHGLSPDEFDATLNVTRTEPPMEAAREILRLASYTP